MITIQLYLLYFIKTVVAVDAIRSSTNHFPGSTIPPSVESMTIWQMLDTPVMIFIREFCEFRGMTLASFAAEWVSFTRDQHNAMPSWSALRSLRYRIIQRESGSSEVASEISKCFLQLGHTLFFWRRPANENGGFASRFPFWFFVGLPSLTKCF